MSGIFFSKKTSVFIIFSLAFFLIYSFLYAVSGDVFNSPDEALNYFYIKNYFQNKSLSYYEPLNEYAGNLVRPRSTLVINNRIVPVGFLGIMLILGQMAGLIGLKCSLFVIPLLSAVTPIFYYHIIKYIFKERIAFLSSLFLYFHPAFMYYSARSLLPNVLLIDLLIISVFLLMQFRYQFSGSKALANAGLAGGALIFFLALLACNNLSLFNL